MAKMFGVILVLLASTFHELTHAKEVQHAKEVHHAKEIHMTGGGTGPGPQCTAAPASSPIYEFHPFQFSALATQRYACWPSSIVQVLIQYIDTLYQ